jgi:hypothetical protein
VLWKFHLVASDCHRELDVGNHVQNLLPSDKLRKQI